MSESVPRLRLEHEGAAVSVKLAEGIEAHFVGRKGWGKDFFESGLGSSLSEADADEVKRRLRDFDGAIVIVRDGNREAGRVEGYNIGHERQLMKIVWGEGQYTGESTPNFAIIPVPYLTRDVVFDHNDVLAAMVGQANRQLNKRVQGILEARETAITARIQRHREQAALKA